MSPADIRQRWYIALDSGFFIPTSKHLRILILGTKYEYRHSPIGVLCAISKLGEFLPEPSEDRNGNQKQTIKHLFHVFDDHYLSPANTMYKECEYENAPASILRHLGLAKYRWDVKNILAKPMFYQRDMSKDIEKEVYLGLSRPYTLSIRDIMENNYIPQQRKFPILATLLKTVESRFASTH